MEFLFVCNLYGVVFLLLFGGAWRYRNGNDRRLISKALELLKEETEWKNAR